MDNSEINNLKERIEKIKKKYIPETFSLKPAQDVNFQFHSKVKEHIWVEIDNYITQIRRDFDKDCWNFNYDIKFKVLKHIVLKYLDKNNLINKEWDSKILTQIKRSIGIIYLLRSLNPQTNKPYSDRAISRMVKYTRVPSYLNEIKKCIGIKKDTKTTRIWAEINSYIIQIRKRFNQRYGQREEDVKLSILKQIVMNHLIQNTDLVSENENPKTRKDIEASIVIIYLLKNDIILKQEVIAEKSGADARKIRNIEHYYGISRILKNDPISQIRVCIRCNRRLSYTKFRKKDGTRIESVCKKCQSIEDSITRFQKKIAAAIFILLKNQRGVKDTNQFLEMLHQCKKFDIDIKCPKCGLGLNFLPALQFHHIDEKLKTISWGKFSDNGIERIITYLDEEKCTLMCSNCHMYEKAKFIVEHLSEISYSENIHWSRYNKNEKRNFRRAIKKKKIIDDLYESSCVYCKKSIYLEDELLDHFLTAVDFHHTIKKLKKHTWGKHLRDKENILYIKNILLKEKQVASCKNCHFMLQAKGFNDGTKYEIFSKYLSDKVLKRLGY